MPVLLCPQQIPRAAYFQIPHRDLEPASQVCKLFDRFQPFLCHFLQHLVPFIHQKGIGRPVGAPHTSPELVQL